MFPITFPDPAFAYDISEADVIGRDTDEDAGRNSEGRDVHGDVGGEEMGPQGDDDGIFVFLCIFVA